MGKSYSQLKKKICATSGIHLTDSTSSSQASSGQVNLAGGGFQKNLTNRFSDLWPSTNKKQQKAVPKDPILYNQLSLMQGEKSDLLNK